MSSPHGADDTGDNALSLELYDQPGHLIRRAQQIATQHFREVLGPEVTPVQYAALRMLQEKPGIDQVTLARLIALDTSTTADMATRLEAKGWIVRELLPRRQRKLMLTEEGQAMLIGFVPNVLQLRRSMLAPLNEQEQLQLLNLLSKLVQLHQAEAGGATRER